MDCLPTYLRVSVTDRCDLRCVYCRPGDDLRARTPHSLRPSEILRFVRQAVACGIEKVRLTGGEPLLHEDIVGIVQGVRAVAGVRALGLTTNGQRLASMARDLRNAGLPSVNISFPSLRAEVYRRVTGGPLRQVMAGLEAALREGFAPVKLNVVVLRGINDDEIEQLARLAQRDPIEVRFIECMPFRQIPSVPVPLVPSDEILQRLGGLGPIRREQPGDAHSSARTFSVGGFRGKVAIIAPMTQPFCAACNRIRLTADGKLRACLVDGGEVDARPVLENGRDSQPLRGLLEQAMRLKAMPHSRRFAGVMTRIGG